MCETYTTLGFQTQLILNRLRNAAALVIIREAPESGIEVATSDEVTKLAAGEENINRYENEVERRPMKLAHSDRPDDREEKSANGEETPEDPKETKSDPKADREYIERRLRDIREFERRYHDGAVDASTVRPSMRNKRRTT